eukprot:Nitzschia sp. Nitz4//scaffold7_size249615//203914//208674//NITZ4_001205-RA/size249615-augustus-gene-0.15-mRNA-1//1//CDS//3329558526//89//frame0
MVISPRQQPTTNTSAEVLVSRQPKRSPQNKSNPSQSQTSIAASAHSSMATKAIGEGNYKTAIDHYQKALDTYLAGSPTLVELVNAAATCFNLGALSKKLHSYPEAANYFRQAEDLYKSCANKVQRAPPNDHTPGATDASSDVCVYRLIIETLQARAHLHYKYQNSLDDAIECHEEVVDVLEQQLHQDRDVVCYKIHFTCLAQEDRWHLLITSLQSLGKFYVEKGEFEDGLVAYQEALSILRESSSPNRSTKQRQDEIAQIIKALSDMFVKSNAANTGVPQLKRVARLQEDLNNFDQALSCWERVLYLESRTHGEESIEVADALCQIARVMVAQGNREGALDLYHAATNKYHQTETPLPRGVVGNTINIFCQLRLYDDALEWLDDMMLHNPNTDEEAWIHCQRGRIHLEQGMLDEASSALCLSAELCEADDDYVFQLLQKLEFLQQRAAKDASTDTVATPPITSGSFTTTQLECIMEDDETSTIQLDPSEDGTSIQVSLSSLEKTGTQESDNASEGTSSRHFMKSASSHAMHLRTDDLFDIDESAPDDERDESPLPLQRDTSLNTTLDVAAMHPIHVTPTGPTTDGKSRSEIENSPREGGSKSTEDTEDSFDSAPRNAPKVEEVPETPPIVLASSFRRTRSKRQLVPNGLDALDEEKEVKAALPSPTSDVFDELSETAVDAPISFISMNNADDDQSQVSQITFKMEEYSGKKSNNQSQWWWGVTAEGLEGWFPTSYVHQAVEAAEGFLSAKAIHDRVKSRPLDFDSDEESDDEKDGTPKESTPESSEKPEDGPDITETLDKPATMARMVSVESSVKPSSVAGSTSVAARSRSGGSGKKTTLSTQIEEKQALLEENKSTDGPDQISVATVLYDLAVLHRKSGEDSAAINSAQQALKIQKATLNMADACQTLHFMAELYSRSTNYKAALACYTEAQQLQEAVFGYFHEETANTLNRIGNVLARQGQFDMAMDSHKEALRILKECYGEEIKNPLVSQTLIQIGAVYYKERNSLVSIQARTDGYTTFIEGGMLEVIGRAHEERGSYRMAIAFFEEKLQFLDESEASKDMEQVAETLNSLGMLSCRAGLYLEAIDYYDRALGIQMKLGCDDVQLAMAKVLAGSVQYSLGHFKKALALFEDAIQTLREEIGDEQETVAATQYHMGVVRVARCEFDEAMEDLQQALQTQVKLLGKGHPASLRTRREIGNLHAMYASGVGKALAEFDDVLATQKRIHGEKHPNVAETLHCIGVAQARKGDLTEALQTLELCYNMRLEFLGTDHPLQAATLHEIAKIQLQNGRVKKALRICDSALDIRTESLSDSHIDVAVTVVTKASCLVAKGSFSEASKLYKDACSVAENAVGGAHPIIADIKVKMGIMHLRTCHFDEASESINEALKLYRAANLDEDYPGILEALDELERVERAEMLCV